MNPTQAIINDWLSDDPANPYGTHRNVLASAVLATHGPVLELGMGPRSTPYLARLCSATDRDFYSFESDAAWFEKFAHLNTGRNLMHCVKSYNEVPVEAFHWSVALIDHAPAERRITEFFRLVNQATFIVIHDTEPGNCNGYDPAWPLFKFRADFRRAFPHTSVVSNLVDPSLLREVLP